MEDQTAYNYFAGRPRVILQNDEETLIYCKVTPLDRERFPRLHHEYVVFQKYKGILSMYAVSERTYRREVKEFAL